MTLKNLSLVDGDDSTCAREHNYWPAIDEKNKAINTMRPLMSTLWRHKDSVLYPIITVPYVYGRLSRLNFPGPEGLNINYTFHRSEMLQSPELFRFA